LLFIPLSYFEKNLDEKIGYSGEEDESEEEVPPVVNKSENEGQTIAVEELKLGETLENIQTQEEKKEVPQSTPVKPKKVKLSREFRAIEMEFGGCFTKNLD